MKRWKQRPEGSTWGDWGDDDELGRINLLTPEKVLRGHRRGGGRHHVLPQPAARLPRRHRAEPAALPAGAGADRGHGRQRRVFNILTRRELDAAVHTTSWGDDRRDPVAAVLDAVGLARPRRRRVRRRRRRRAPSRLLQRLPRRRRPRRPERPTPRGDGCGHALASPTTSASSTWRPRRAGPRRARRPRAPPRPRARKAVELDDAPGDHGGRQRRGGAGRHAAAPHRLRQRGPRVEQGARPGETLHRSCTVLDARDESLLEWIADSQISALVADNYAVEAMLGAARADEDAHRCCRSTTSACSSSASAGRDVVPARARRRGCASTTAAASC